MFTLGVPGLQHREREVLALGENKRYRAYYDRLLDDWIERFVMREEPMMLTEAEVDLEHHPAHEFHPSRRVYAWIRYPSQAHLVEAEATAWTDTAIRIWFFEPKIKIHREGWVWRSAVRPAPPEEK